MQQLVDVKVNPLQDGRHASPDMSTSAQKMALKNALSQLQHMK